MKKTIKGFTLVELVITISIIVILSLVSGPIYKGYMKSSRFAEGYTVLAAIRDSQIAYFAEYRSFFSTGVWSSNNVVLGIDVRSNKYFTLFTINKDSQNIYFTAAATSPFGSVNLSYNRTSGVTFR